MVVQACCRDNRTKQSEACAEGCQREFEILQGEVLGSRTDIRVSYVDNGSRMPDPIHTFLALGLR